MLNNAPKVVRLVSGMGSPDLEPARLTAGCMPPTLCSPTPYMCYLISVAAYNNIAIFVAPPKWKGA